MLALSLSTPKLLAGSVCGPDFGHSTGAIGRICMPSGPWNGDLVVFAHGYVSPEQELAIPEDQLELPGGASIPQIVNGLGFAFAVTSYRKNGLAVLPGIEDVLDLVTAFESRIGNPDHVYLVGASEGGLVTALGVERHPEVFSGGVAACGPVGDFRRQVNYWGDFRVLFDYFFPGVLPGSAVSVPQQLRDDWDTIYEPAVTAALLARPAALDALLRVGRVPFDPGEPQTKLESALGILWYNVFATEDGIDVLGGQPFDNRLRFYTGSSNDFWLNLRVRRHRADLAAVQELQANYQTSGRLARPIVTLHTTGDPVVPYWHEPIYRLKTLLGGSPLLHLNLPVARYGHCQFEPEEAVVALGLLVLYVEGSELVNPESVLWSEPARERFRALAGAMGLRR